MKAAVGGKPAILGSKLEMKHFHGQLESVKYTEVDIDVCSSVIAGKVPACESG